MNERLSSALVPTLGLVLFTVTVWALHRQLATYGGYEEVLARLGAISRTRLALAFALTVAGYLSLAGYDVLALHHLGRRLAYPRVVLASFVAYVVSHNVGPAFLGGSASLRGPAPQPAGRRATRCASLDSSGDDLS